MHVSILPQLHNYTDTLLTYARIHSKFDVISGQIVRIMHTMMEIKVEIQYAAIKMSAVRNERQCRRHTKKLFILVKIQYGC